MGVAAEQAIPATFGPNQHLLWKTKLPGGGASSPVLWGDRIYLTAYIGYAVPGEAAGSLERLERLVLCLDRKGGGILWTRSTPARLPEEPTIREGHGYAASTPAVDDQGVVVFFGKSGVLAFDHAGNERWRADVGDATNGWGSATSPIFYQGKVLVSASVESESLVALDRATGNELGRAGGVREAWNTPLVVANATGGSELIVPIFEKVLAFDPDTLAPLWSCGTDIPWYMVPTAVARDGVVYCIGGRPGGSLAIRTGGRGDVTESQRLWTSRKGGNVSSPILFGDHLYWMHDNLGIAFCASLETGQLQYEQRLERAGMVYASPVLVGDRIYYLTREGRVFVVRAAPKFELLATNDLNDGTVFNASPAVADGRLYVRSDGWLYCFGDR
jgi:outer membrane protein assembly factor BamB